jgi:hypothetical protein
MFLGYDEPLEGYFASEDSREIIFVIIDNNWITINGVQYTRYRGSNGDIAIRQDLKISRE